MRAKWMIYALVALAVCGIMAVDEATSHPVFDAVYADGVIEFVPAGEPAAESVSSIEVNGWTLHRAVHYYRLPAQAAMREPITLGESGFSLSPMSLPASEPASRVCGPERIVCIGVVPVYRSPFNSHEWRNTDAIVGKYGRHAGWSATIPFPG